MEVLSAVQSSSFLLIPEVQHLRGASQREHGSPVLFFVDESSAKGRKNGLNPECHPAWRDS